MGTGTGVRCGAGQSMAGNAGAGVAGAEGADMPGARGGGEGFVGSHCFMGGTSLVMSRELCTLRDVASGEMVNWRVAMTTQRAVAWLLERGARGKLGIRF